MASCSSSTSAPRFAARAGAARVLGALLVLLVVVFAVAAAADGVTVTAADYGNNDISVNTINQGSKLLLAVQTTPRYFNAHAFTQSAYALFAAADTAITSMTKVIMVSWCAKTTLTLNSSMYCANGSMYNDDDSYPYVFVQMRLPSWDASSVATPDLVDLSSLSVEAKLLVSAFAGTYDPDTNTTTGGSDYITKYSYNTAAVFAVFGVLLAIVVISLIVMCVCICRSDNAMAGVNKDIIDKAIHRLRASRSASSRGRPPTFVEHYNISGDAVSVGPIPPATVPASAANYSPREGGDNSSYPPSMDSRTNAREMHEMKSREMAGDNAATLQKPTL